MWTIFTNFVSVMQVPLSNVSEGVYKTSTDWINQRSFEALGSFVLWSLDSIFSDLALHQRATKGAKTVVQLAPSKSQVIGCNLFRESAFLCG